MSEERYDSADDLAMREVQKGIIDAILPVQDRIPTWLIVLALTRVLRAVLRKAPKPKQRELLPIVTAYLNGRTQQPEEKGASPLLWTPERGN